MAKGLINAVDRSVRIPGDHWGSEWSGITGRLQEDRLEEVKCETLWKMTVREV